MKSESELALVVNVPMHDVMFITEWEKWSQPLLLSYFPKIFWPSNIDV